MPIPMQALTDNTNNIYTLTCAMIKRALQITVTGDEDIDKNNGKVVSAAINQVLTKKVEYRLEG